MMHLAMGHLAEPLGFNSCLRSIKRSGAGKDIFPSCRAIATIRFQAERRSGRGAPGWAAPDERPEGNQGNSQN